MMNPIHSIIADNATNECMVAQLAERLRRSEDSVREQCKKISHDTPPEKCVSYRRVLELALQGKVTL